MLRDVDLVLRPGQRVLLVGASGSGKSTLLRALAGLLTTVDAGELTGTVTLDGRAPDTRPGDVGLVLQEPGAGVVASTVGRDVAFGLENTLVPPADMADRVARALAAVALDLPTNTPTTALSGGQTQRLALAGTLALAPRLLLLDEPTAMLDPENAARVRDVVATVLDETGLTCVVVEHRLGPWVEVVDRLVVLDDDGRLVVDGPVGPTLAAERERLLAMGIWVPGAPDPDPVPLTLARPFDAAATASTPGPRPPRTPGVPRAGELTVDRVVRNLDGTTRTVHALDLAEPLAPAPGEDVAVVGPSGSGKSTLLLTLAGFLEPTAGAVRVDEGRDVADLDVTDLPRAVAWVPQWSSSAIVARTVLDELTTTSERLGTATDTTRSEAEHVLGALGLAHLAQADPRRLSGGEQRRVALAAAVLHRPALLLADEPTVGQDRHTWAAVAGLLEAHRAAGGASVTSTHDAALVARAGRVVRLAPPVEGGGAPPPSTGQRRPLLATRSPLALLLAAFLAVPAGVLVTSWQRGLAVLAVEALLSGLGLLAPRTRDAAGPAPRGRLRTVALRLVPGLLAALSVAWSTWWLAGHDASAAAAVALRVLVIVVPSAVLVPWIDPDRLGDHLAQRLHLPARPVVAVAAALARVHTFGEVWTEIGRARRVRGLGWSWRRPTTLARHLGALTLGLLVRTLRGAADLAVAMDSRGFAGAQRRTWFAPARWRAADTLLVLLATLPLATAAWLNATR